MPVINRIPYRNLILTGYMGVGKTAIGRRISQRMDVSFYDIENEIEAREGQPAETIRSLFGEARLRTLETEILRELSLVRSSVVAVNGTTLLDTTNLDKARQTGPVLCLTAALNEILRRFHVAQGARFHNPDSRAIVLGRLKREMRVLSLGLPELDTTGLDIDTVSDRATSFWMAQSDM
ncbi:MAG: hypothetical protein GYB66_06490 [Chloroflexi bacterium]|nr:hypothetical protein [Chloroflexota bacterium]